MKKGILFFLLFGCLSTEYVLVEQILFVSSDLEKVETVIVDSLRATSHINTKEVRVDSMFILFYDQLDTIKVGANSNNYIQIDSVINLNLEYKILESTMENSSYFKSLYWSDVHYLIFHEGSILSNCFKIEFDYSPDNLSSIKQVKGCK